MYGENDGTFSQDDEELGVLAARAAAPVRRRENIKRKLAFPHLRLLLRSSPAVIFGAHPYLPPGHSSPSEQACDKISELGKKFISCNRIQI